MIWWNLMKKRTVVFGVAILKKKGICKMDIKRIMEAYINDINAESRTRRIGKTKALMNMAKNLPVGSTILCSNMNQVAYVKRMYNELTHGSITDLLHIISMQSSLEGVSGPFIFDHFALYVLFMETLKRINALEEELDYSYQNVASLKEENKKLNEKLCEIRIVLNR
jgi:hypothetical protein